MNQNKQSQLYSAEALRLNSHKTMRKLFLAVFAFFMTATLTFLITQNMKNTNAASFQAGNIMSDAVMGNYNSMSEADIQNFLKSKNSCNKYSSSAGDYSEVYGSKTYTWHVRNHRYVCMADDTFNGESAAHIIYTVAHEYRINPQVLIVLLQKEQGLITDQFPNSWQYNKAAGFGCPDTAPCDAQYYGLRTQLSKAANLFRTVLDGGWSNYPVGNNYVQYHPNQACGGSVINIENRATSALYRYTPYQPNGALLCGGSDGCSSYGNYNFYNYFTNWFGDTHSAQDDEALRAIEKKASTNNIREEIGLQTSSLQKNDQTGIYWVEYEKGVIVGNVMNGFYISKGETRKVWQQHHFESGVLGFPTSDIVVNTSTGFVYQNYQNGAVVGSDATGYYISFGKIRDVWQKQGFEYGELGLPVSTIIKEPTGIFYQNYQGGVVVGQDTTGFYISKGETRKVWQQHNFESGILGFPTSDIITNDSTGLSYQKYQGGTIECPKSSVCSVSLR